MKTLLLRSLPVLLSISFLQAQTNTFPTSGDVGIGTTSPHAKLHVIGDVRSYKDGADTISSHMYIGNAANNRAWNWQLTANGNSSLWGYDGTWWNEIVRFNATGNVGIGTANPSHKLAVKGTIRAQEVIVEVGWADYVFASDYRLAPLAEVEAHIKEKGHLPGIPTAAEVAKHGASLGEVQTALLAKVEELTLHLIRIEKEKAALLKRVEGLEAAAQPETSR